MSRRLARQERHGEPPRRCPGVDQHGKGAGQRVDLIVLAAEWKVAQLLEKGVIPAAADDGEVARLRPGMPLGTRASSWRRSRARSRRDSRPGDRRARSLCLPAWPGSSGRPMVTDVPSTRAASPRLHLQPHAAAAQAHNVQHDEATGFVARQLDTGGPVGIVPPVAAVAARSQARTTTSRHALVTRPGRRCNRS